MELILWRHAEAEDAVEGMADVERKLTPKGHKQARAIAKWLAPRLPKDVRILASPARRTRQTAEALGLPFEIEPKIGTAADPTDLIEAAGWSGHEGAVVLVGHQPTLGRLAARLLSGSDADWPVKKGAIWWISRRREGETVLRAVIGPDLA